MTTRAQKNSYCKAMYQRRRAAGLCAECKAPSGDHACCSECRAYRRERAAMLAELRKEAACAAE